MNSHHYINYLSTNSDKWNSAATGNYRYDIINFRIPILVT